MDTNNDGSLSNEEFSGFGQEFFLSNDESSPSKHFFGPLVNWNWYHQKDNFFIVFFIFVENILIFG